SLLDRIEDIAGRLTALETLLVSGGPPEPGAAPFHRVPLAAWRESRSWAGAMPAASDIACIMYTSGTTGPAKGGLMPHAHCFLFGLGTIDNLRLTERDRFYVALPLFHANGLFMQLGAALIAGASAVLRERFSASAWLPDIRRFDATVTNTLGAVTAF